MLRDKRGRFVKKATIGGTVTDGGIVFIGGRAYKIKPGTNKAYEFYKSGGGTDDFNTWITTYKNMYLADPTSVTANMEHELGSSTQNLTLSYDKNDPFGLQAQQQHKNQLVTDAITGVDGMFATDKITYSLNKNNQFVDQYGNNLTVLDIGNKDVYEYKHTPVEVQSTDADDVSAGMTVVGGKKDNKQKKPWSINKTDLANWLELTRAGIGAYVNNKIAERALEAEKPFLQDVAESHRSILGDYRSQIQGEKAAAQLRNMAAKPLTSDGALQQSMMLDAQIKGQEYIDQGNAADEAAIKESREAAWEQEKENQQQRQAAAMANRQAMLMSQKNKVDIENMRDSANFSQVVSPLLAATEQRLRNKGKEQEAYQDYYNQQSVSYDVWNTYRDGLSDVQKTLADTYRTSGLDGVTQYMTNNNISDNEWLQTQRILNTEILRRKAALKGVTLNLGTNYSSNPYEMWEPKQIDYTSINKKGKGGTIYKAKLTKRTKDNDRGAKSIESSKKIAAKFLEKAIDSLYTYNDVELIAKPKKRKRKYQSGGGLPFVNFTPVFATSETGATPKATEDEGLTSKDVLTLLKDMDGLPSDMQLIVSSLKNFSIQDQMDPLGLSSSADTASRYISLINKIKVAKFNKDEYNNAFNQLKGNGGLNEFAITSEGLLIGTNQEGDFEYFTPDQVNAGEPKQQGYSLLTNSNLLYLRANSTDAAFNHHLTTFAQNGIGMEVITKQIGDILQNLGSSKESEEGFVQMGSNGNVKAGIKFLQKAAQEVGDDSINQNMSVADYYQAGYLTEDQAQQAQLALNYIWSALPANAKSLLQVKGGSTEGAEAIVKSLVYSKTSSNTQFKASPKKMTKDSSSSSGDGVSELKLTPVQMMQVGYTDHMPVTLQKGTKYAMTVNAQVLPITNVNKELLGVTTLDKVAESTFGGALDMNNVTMGSQLIDPHALQNVQIDSTNLYVMNLPIDRNSQDGTIKPDLAWMTKIEEIDRTIRDKGITDIAQINKLYTDAGLPVLMDDNGQLNTRDYCKFGVLNGHALNSAFKDLDLLDNTVLEIDDEDQINNIMNILNKGRNEKDRLDFDSKSWADSIFGTDHDSLFEGTIYIPIRTNAFTGMIGGGQYPDTETAAEIEALVQQKERTRGYVDPGLLN